MKYVTLCHEMIHAYMWSILEEEGLIYFDASGTPAITFGCEGYIPNLNAISMEDPTAGVLTMQDMIAENGFKAGYERVRRLPNFPNLRNLRLQHQKIRVL